MSALVFKTLLPDTFGSPDNAFWIGAFTTVILTGIYTVFGGMRAVLFTDAAQAVVLLVGSAVITFFGLNALGGWGELKIFVSQDVARYALWRPMSDPDFPWLGILIASPIVGIWYWCTDQYIDAFGSGADRSGAGPDRRHVSLLFLLGVTASPRAAG